MITGVVLARNEERNIVECLKALRPHVAEILLIDMESSDQTVALARPYVAKVISHPVIPNFDAARNVALRDATHNWLWFVDADERISTQTGELVNRLIRSHGDQFEALAIPFKTYFCGKWIQHSGWWPGYTMARVLKRGCFRFVERLHGGVDVVGRRLNVPPDPQLAIDHFSYNSIEHYIEKLNRYTTTEARQLVTDGVKPDWKSAIHQMMHDMWRCYEQCDGRLDGEHGWILAWLSGQYRWLSHAKMIDARPAIAESGERPNAPINLDEVIGVMETGLALSRLKQPEPPLGIVWRSPIYDRSGYADEGRTFVKALSQGERPLVLEEVRWGNQESGVAPEERALYRALSTARRAAFVVTITDTIPLYVRRDPAACLNVIRTTFETDRIPPNWLQFLEPFDEIWVIAEHNRRAFCRSGVPPEKIRVVPSCIDTRRYRPDGDRLEFPATIEGRFVFLSVFDWALRKGWDLLLRAYCQEFDRSERTALYLKVTRSHGHTMELIRQQVDTLLAECDASLAMRDDIVITDDSFTEEQMAALYRSVDAFVMPSRGEGWGRPYLEAMATGLPTIGTNASGNIDFMNEHNSFLVPAVLVDVPDGAVQEIAVYAGHRWYEPDFDELRRQMRRVKDDPSECNRIARQAIADVKTRFDLAAGRAGIERALKLAEGRFVHRPAPPPTPDQIRIELDGELFARHSFANVNEQLALEFSKSSAVALSIRRSQNYPTFDSESTSRHQLVPFIERRFERGPQVTIRHSYPPNWNPPEQGRWVHIQPWEFGCLPTAWLKPLQERVDEVWVPSNYVRQVYIDSGVSPGKLHVIPWGVNPDVMSPDAVPLLLPAKRFKFLYVGGTIHRKGIDIVLEAYLREFQAEEDVSLIVKDMGTNSFYADSHQRERVIQAAADNANPHILYSEHYLTDGQLACLYASCECLVAPYRGEGFGLPILEAMACGVVPIIPRGGPSDDYATESTAIFLPSQKVEEDFKPDICGRPSHLRVEVDDLRKAMRRAFDDRTNLASMKTAASQHVRTNFTWSRTVAAMIARIETLVQPEPPLAASQQNLTVLNTGSRTVEPPFLAAFLSVGDDEYVLASSLSHVAPFVDEIIVVPNSSSDRSITIANEYGAKVEATWSGAWNRAIADGQAMNFESDIWLLILRPRECISEVEGQAIKPMLRALPGDVAVVRTRIGEPATNGRNHLEPESRIRLLRCRLESKPDDGHEREFMDYIQQARMRIIDADESSDSNSHSSESAIRSCRRAGTSKAALLTFATGEHRRFLEISLPFMQEYATRYGYDLIVGEGSSDGRAPSWGKIPLDRGLNNFPRNGTALSFG